MRVLYRLSWVIVVCSVVAASSSALGGTPTTEFASDPVLVGAGDIADCTRTTDSATASLLSNIAGTVITLGDNTYPNGEMQYFQNCYEPTWGLHKYRTRPSPGNHEYYAAGAAPYFEYFGAQAGPPGRGYYSYDLGAWHIVSLNSSIEAYAGSAQETWLRNDLAAHPAACTLAYWHQPLFTSGLHGNDPSVRDLYRALYDAGADVVLNGHDHDYEQFHRQNPDGIADVNGIREFVVGTGGGILRPFPGSLLPTSAVASSATHGVLKLTLHPTSFDWQFVPVAGGTFTDSGSKPCVGNTAAGVGGRGFALGGSPSGVNMVWTTGTAQSGYLVARGVDSTVTFLPGTSNPLPAVATDYTDAGAPPQAMACYTLMPLNGASVLGKSDILCQQRAASSSGAPGSTMLQLNQGGMATLTWSAPGGQTAFGLWRVPVDGAPKSMTWLPASATRVMNDTGGNPTCYVVFAVTGNAVSGNSDALCAVPGRSTLP